MFSRLKKLLLTNRGTQQTIVKNVFWMGMSQVVSRLIRAIFIVYVARILGAEGYGVFSYILGLTAFFTIFGDLGINPILTRETSRDPSQASKYFATLFGIKVTFSTISAFLILIITPFFSNIDGVATLLPFAALLVVFDNLRDFATAFFRGKEKMEREAFVVLFTNLAITIFGFLILRFSPNILSLIATYAICSGLGILVSVFFLKKELLGVFRNFDFALVSPLLRMAIPFAIAGILGSFMLNTDLIILGWMTNAQAIGFYSSGQKIIQVLYVVPAILASGIFPALSRFVGKNESEKMSALMEKTITISYFFALPIALGGIILGKPIMEFLYGAEYLPGTVAFQILLLTVPLVFSGTLFGNFLFANNRQKKLALFTTLTAIGNIIFDVLFIYYWGIAGSAVATLLMQILYNILAWRLIKSFNHISVFSHLKKILVATLGLGIIAFILNLLGIHVLLTILISGLVYLGILFVTKEHVIRDALDIIKIVQTKPSEQKPVETSTSELN